MMIVWNNMMIVCSRVKTMNVNDASMTKPPPSCKGVRFLMHHMEEESTLQ